MKFFVSILPQLNDCRNIQGPDQCFVSRYRTIVITRKTLWRKTIDNCGNVGYETLLQHRSLVKQSSIQEWFENASRTSRRSDDVDIFLKLLACGNIPDISQNFSSADIKDKHCNVGYVIACQSAMMIKGDRSNPRLQLCIQRRFDPL